MPLQLLVRKAAFLKATRSSISVFKKHTAMTTL